MAPSSSFSTRYGVSSAAFAPSCGASVRECAAWSTIVAVVEPTTIWRPRKEGPKLALGSVSTVVAGTAGTAGVEPAAGTAAVPATWA